MIAPSNTTPPKTNFIPTGYATIVVEAAGVGAPLTIRVRRMLKFLLRTHGLRCVRCDLPKESEARSE